MTNTKMRPMVALLAVLFTLSSLTCASALQGKLEKFGPLGNLPASFVTVTLNSRDTGKVIKTEHTDYDGIYYFNECKPGIYMLKIWIKGPYGMPLDFGVSVLDQPLTNIAPILIHSFKFKYPEEGQTFPNGIAITAKGTHYNLPEDAFVWLVLKHRNGNYYLTDRSIEINSDGSWKSRTIYVIEGTMEILAVLVTRKVNNEFRLRIISNNWLHYSKLPTNSCIIAQRKIDVH